MNRVNTFLQLQKCHDDQVIGPEELAALLNTTHKVVYKIHSDSPSKLPPRLVLFGRKLCWRLGTCREWVRALEAAHIGATVKNPAKNSKAPKVTSAQPIQGVFSEARLGRPRNNA
jgi:hypothetical protein